MKKFVLKINQVGFIFDTIQARKNTLLTLVEGDGCKFTYNGNIEKKEPVEFSIFTVDEKDIPDAESL